MNIDDKNIISLLSILNKSQINTSFNYIIGNIEEKKEIDKDIEKNYHNNIIKIIEMDKNNVEKILFDYNFFFGNSNISILNINKNKEQEIITSNPKIYKINKLKRSLLMLDLLEEKRRKKRKWKKEYN